MGVLEFLRLAFAMPKNRIATFDAKHSKLPLPWLCITADRSPKFPKLIDVSADLTVTDSAGFRELRDCCSLKKQGFRCAELPELCGERELCVRHSKFPKSDICIFLSHWSAALSPAISTGLGLLQPQPIEVIRQDVAIGVAHAHCVALRAVLCDYC
jgi:hypothetical protein